MTLYLEGAGVVAACFAALWVVSVLRRDASIIDPVWGLGFVAVVWFWHVRGDAVTVRATAQAIAVTVWGVRLSGYLAWRNHGAGEDFRYRAMREKAPKTFPYASLVTVFLLQAAILVVVALPLFAVQRADLPVGITPFDVAGLVVFLVGLTFESVGDLQMARFKADPGNRGKVLDRGLWRYTRHPNYFGDAVVWWGLYLPALAVPGGWWTAVGPLVMTGLLMKVSGVALLEKTLAATKPAYRDYVERTPAFFPGLPKGD